MKSPDRTGPAAPDQGSGTDAPPRITGRRRLECLEHELADLLSRWDRTTNPVLHLAAGQLRLAMRQAQTVAHEPRLEWEEARHAEGSDLVMPADLPVSPDAQWREVEYSEQEFPGG